VYASGERKMNYSRVRARPKLPAESYDDALHSDEIQMNQERSSASKKVETQSKIINHLKSLSSRPLKHLTSKHHLRLFLRSSFKPEFLELNLIYFSGNLASRY
jgi:hypothetical protein